MSEVVGSPYSSLGEQAKKIDIALYYTFGDMDKAKQIVAGTYKDVYVIKAKFSSTTIFGAFIAFVNFRVPVVNSVTPIVSHDYEVGDIKTNQDWRTFEHDIQERLSKNLHDAVLGRQFSDVMTRSLDHATLSELSALVQTKSEIEINRLFQGIAQHKLAYQAVNISVDIEVISSLDMEIQSSTSRKIDPHEVQRRKEEEAKRAEPKLEEFDEEDEVLKAREIKLMLNGALVLSPIRGKDISQVISGDRIMISVLDKHPRAVQVVKAFNAYVDGEFKPIPGRVLSIRMQSDRTYKIIAVVAKGIFARIIEDQGNIKIAMLSSGDDYLNEDNEPLSRRALVLLVLLGIVLIAMIGAIVYIIFR